MDDRDLLRLSVAIQVAKTAMEDLTAAFDSLPPEIKAAITAEPERGRLRANIPKEGGSNYWAEVLGEPMGNRRDGGGNMMRCSVCGVMVEITAYYLNVLGGVTCPTCGEGKLVAVPGVVTVPDPREAELPDREKERPERETKPL